LGQPKSNRIRLDIGLRRATATLKLLHIVRKNPGALLS
jgi:hypothetical protein